MLPVLPDMQDITFTLMQPLRMTTARLVFNGTNVQVTQLGVGVKGEPRACTVRTENVRIALR